MKENNDQDSHIDWNKCMMCQKDSQEILQCPAESKRKDLGAGYISLAKNIKRFEELKSLPMKLDIEKLSEGQRLEDTLLKRKAKVHKTCKDKFSNLKLLRAEKRKSADSASGETSTSKYLRSSCESPVPVQCCFFCDVSGGEVRKVMTTDLDVHVRECAEEMNDNIILGKLSAGDMFAQDAVYHLKCLTAFYRRAEKCRRKSSSKQELCMNQSIALADIIAYIEERCYEADQPPIFKLTDLSKIYCERLVQYNVDHTTVHNTRLKERILAQCPDLEEYRTGRDIYLSSRMFVTSVLKDKITSNQDKDALILSKAANIIRHHILSMQETHFTGQFDTNCQTTSVPQLLVSHIDKILTGRNISDQETATSQTQAALSISQLIRFNCTVRRRKDSMVMYHSKLREPPLPVYVGLLLHAETRKKGLVNKMSDLGLAISYNRVLEISTAIGNMATARYKEEGVVAPLNLCKGIFTTSAVDNIDHNPSSTTAIGSLHGTGISLFQHPTAENPGRKRAAPIISGTEHKKLLPLPETYTSISPVQQWKKEPAMPKRESISCEQFTATTPCFTKSMELQYR